MITGTFLAVGNLIDIPPFLAFRILTNWANEYLLGILCHLHNDFFKNFQIRFGDPGKNAVHILVDALGYIVLYLKCLFGQHKFFIPPVAGQALTA